MLDPYFLFILGVIECPNFELTFSPEETHARRMIEENFFSPETRLELEHYAFRQREEHGITLSDVSALHRG